MSNKVIIDLDRWVTPRQLARELGYDKNRPINACTQRISNWIIRKKVKSLHIKELDLILIDRSTIPAHA